MKSGSSGVPSKFDSTVRLNAMAGPSSAGSSAAGSRRTIQSSARLTAASPPLAQRRPAASAPCDLQAGLVEPGVQKPRVAVADVDLGPRRVGQVAPAPLRRCGSTHSRRARTRPRRPPDRPSLRAAPRAAPRPGRRNGHRTGSIADGSRARNRRARPPSPAPPRRLRA